MAVGDGSLEYFHLSLGHYRPSDHEVVGGGDDFLMYEKVFSSWCYS